jgi:metal-sulfur cluster biosynthetic enzyme
MALIKIDSILGLCYHPDSKARERSCEGNSMSEQTQITEEGMREALREVVDPEIGMNIIELGLIRNIEIEEDRTHMTMIMTTPFCPYAPQLLEQTRRTAQNYARRPTTIEMGLEMWDPSMMEEGAADDWGLF